VTDLDGLMKRGTKPSCHRCGTDLPCVDVTTWGDDTRQYIATDECPCPRPICPFCRHDLTAGTCYDAGCFMCGRIIPIPEVA
jgi:hypothetical protein